METPDQSYVSRKLRDAAIGLDDPHDQARAVIYAAMAINGGMGFVPVGINMVSFLAVDTAMVTLVGSIYGFHYTNEQVATLLKTIVTSVGFSTGVYLGVAKFFAESAKATGAAVLPFYFLGASMDGALCAAVTYAVGFTTKTFFEREAVMSKSEMRTEFRRHLRDGKKQSPA